MLLPSLALAVAFAVTDDRPVPLPDRIFRFEVDLSGVAESERPAAFARCSHVLALRVIFLPFHRIGLLEDGTKSPSLQSEGEHVVLRVSGATGDAYAKDLPGLLRPGKLLFRRSAETEDAIIDVDAERKRLADHLVKAESESLPIDLQSLAVSASDGRSFEWLTRAFPEPSEDSIDARFLLVEVDPRSSFGPADLKRKASFESDVFAFEISRERRGRREAFADFIATAEGRKLVVVLDGVALKATLRVLEIDRYALDLGHCGFTQDELRQTIATLKGGELPCPVRLLSG